VRFHVEQRIPADVRRVSAAFADPAFFESLRELPQIGKPEVVSHERDGDRATLRVRYRFVGHLSAAVTAVVDPKKLSWVEESVHDLASGRVTFRMRPDHYGDRFASHGTYRFQAAGDDQTVRIVDGEVTIRMPIVGGRVEAAIVSGIKEHLDAEGALVVRYLAE